MATIIKIQGSNQKSVDKICSCLREANQEATVLVKLPAQKLDNVFDDGQGRLLTITPENEFIVDGEVIFNLDYTDFRWKEGILAISRKHEEGYAIFIQGQLVFETSSECDWTLINGKVVASCNQGLFYNGTKILEKEDYQRWGVFHDRLFIEDGLGCHQVLLPEQL